MEILKLLEGIRTPILDNLMFILTQLGGEIVSVLLIIVLYYYINKRFGMRFAIAFCYSGIIIQGVKLIFRVERPWVRDSSIHAVKIALDGATGYSFPSAHSFQITVVCVMLALYLTGSECRFEIMKKKANKILAWIVAFVVIAIVMFSRMYLGVHTPADVLTGGAIGAVCAVIVTLLYRRYFLKNVSDKASIRIAVSMVIMAMIVSVYAICLYNLGTTEYKNASDAVKMCATSIGVALGWVFERRKVNFKAVNNGMIKNILKVALGLAVLFAIKEGLKYFGIAIYKETLIMDSFRYILAIFWLVGIYPIYIKKYFNAK